MDDFWIKVKIVFDRGRLWVGYLTFLMMVFVTITSMKQYAYFQFLAGRYWLLIVLGGSFITIFVLGFIEVKILNIYQREAKIYARMNPIQQEIFENQAKIIKKIEEIEKKIS